MNSWEFFHIHRKKRTWFVCSFIKINEFFTKILSLYPTKRESPKHYVKIFFTTTTQSDMHGTIEWPPAAIFNRTAWKNIIPYVGLSESRSMEREKNDEYSNAVQRTCKSKKRGLIDYLYDTDFAYTWCIFMYQSFKTTNPLDYRWTNGMKIKYVDFLYRIIKSILVSRIKYNQTGV